MKRTGKFLKGTALSVALVMATGIFSSALAADLDLQKQFEEINKKIEEQQSLVQQKKKEENKAYLELKQLNSTLTSTEKSLRQTENKLSTTEKELQKLEQELQASQAELEKSTQILDTRLNTIYREGDVHILEVLFNSTSLTDFLTRWDLISRLAQNDTEIIDGINAEIKTYQEKQQLVMIKKDSLLQLQQDQDSQKHQLQLASSRQKQLYNALQDDRESAEAALEELAEESERISAELRKLAGGDTSQYLGSGKMYWPTPGYTRITSPYGWRIHPITKKRSMHTGVDIAAPNGSTIKSAEAGTVLEVAWRGAYGRVIMVNHGGGIVTLYAHTSASLVQVGQQVTRGQAIGKIGTTGWSTGPHLHFEVRVNGDTFNPMNYLK